MSFSISNSCFFKCLWYNDCPNVNITLVNLPFKIGQRFGWQICSMDISLQFDIFIYENWLIVAVIYHSSEVGDRREVLLNKGRGEGIWFRKTTKS